MKLWTFLLLFFSYAATGADDKIYQVIPNTSSFPLPYELPNLTNTDASKFDWDQYLAAGKSKADRAFRAKVAHMDYGQQIPDGCDSNAEEATRHQLAADEFKATCDDLIRRYRLKLQTEPELLKKWETYVQRSEEAIELQVELIGGSWGGSGVRLAYATARMKAYLNFSRNLEAMGDSLHLQDLPQ